MEPLVELITLTTAPSAADAVASALTQTTADAASETTTTTTATAAEMTLCTVTLAEVPTLLGEHLDAAYTEAFPDVPIDVFMSVLLVALLFATTYCIVGVTHHYGAHMRVWRRLAALLVDILYLPTWFTMICGTCCVQMNRDRLYTIMSYADKMARKIEDMRARRRQEANRREWQRAHPNVPLPYEMLPNKATADGDVDDDELDHVLPGTNMRRATTPMPRMSCDTLHCLGCMGPKQPDNVQPPSDCRQAYSDQIADCSEASGLCVSENCLALASVVHHACGGKVASISTASSLQMMRQDTAVDEAGYGNDDDNDETKRYEGVDDADRIHRRGAKRATHKRSVATSSPPSPTTTTPLRRANMLAEERLWTTRTQLFRSINQIGPWISAFGILWLWCVALLQVARISGSISPGADPDTLATASALGLTRHTHHYDDDDDDDDDMSGGSDDGSHLGGPHRIRVVLALLQPAFATPCDLLQWLGSYILTRDVAKLTEWALVIFLVCDVVWITLLTRACWGRLIGLIQDAGLYRGSAVQYQRTHLFLRVSSLLTAGIYCAHLVAAILVVLRWSYGVCPSGNHTCTAIFIAVLIATHLLLVCACLYMNTAFRYVDPSMRRATAAAEAEAAGAAAPLHGATGGGGTAAAIAARGKGGTLTASLSATNQCMRAGAVAIVASSSVKTLIMAEWLLPEPALMAALNIAAQNMAFVRTSLVLFIALPIVLYTHKAVTGSGTRRMQELDAQLVFVDDDADDDADDADDAAAVAVAAK
jgi:hypothetical protein